MRTGELTQALAALDTAIAGAPRDPALRLVRSVVLEFAGDLSGALATARHGLGLAPTEVSLLQQAAHLSAESGDASAALTWAREAAALGPNDPAVAITLCEALLGSGEVLEAESVASRLHAANPLDQHAIALQATAWRLKGDPRYGQLHDYSSVVASERLAPPAGWSSLEAFLDDLKHELESLHRFSTHPFQQSVRGGAQLPLHEAEMSRPVVRALFAGIDAVILRRLAMLGTQGDPFRTRNTGRYTVTGAWSIRLASGGFHTDHVHPRGWLSAVFYAHLPPEVAKDPVDGARAGWLRLGRAGIRTAPQLAPDAYVKPEPGLLVLFPAYVWHGVERFESASPRISVAFDALPA
jgi:hypothetical protein